MFSSILCSREAGLEAVNIVLDDPAGVDQLMFQLNDALKAQEKVGHVWV